MRIAFWCTLMHFGLGLDNTPTHAARARTRSLPPACVLRVEGMLCALVRAKMSGQFVFFTLQGCAECSGTSRKQARARLVQHAHCRTRSPRLELGAIQWPCVLACSPACRATCSEHAGACEACVACSSFRRVLMSRARMS
jgi:hypothetical protein